MMPVMIRKDIKKCVIQREIKFKIYQLSKRNWNKTAEKKINADVEKVKKKQKIILKRQNINTRTTAKVIYWRS